MRAFRIALMFAVAALLPWHEALTQGVRNAITPAMHKRIHTIAPGIIGFSSADCSLESCNSSGTLGETCIDKATSIWICDGAGSFVEFVSGGDVVGPGSATDNALVRFNTTTGKLIQDYTSDPITGSDVGIMSVPSGFLTIGSATNDGILILLDSTVTSCIDVDSDRLYGDKDCSGAKGAGEEYLDSVGGGDDITVQAAFGDPVDPIFNDTTTIGVTATDASPDTVTWDIVGDSVGTTEVDEGANFAFTNLAGATLSTGNLVLSGAGATVDGIDVGAHDHEGGGTDGATVADLACTDCVGTTDLDLAITPTWTGAHSWDGVENTALITLSGTTGGGASPSIQFTTDVASERALLRVNAAGQFVVIGDAGLERLAQTVNGSAGTNHFTLQDGNIILTLASATVDGRNLDNVVDLAGQLGGTVSSPDVRGLRTTTGPTLLTMAAVVDGQCLRRTGSTIDSATCGGGGDGVGYDEILDEATGRTKRAQVNFIGAGVSCIDNPGATRTDCTISGSGGPATDIQTSDTTLTVRGQVRIPTATDGLFYYDDQEVRVAVGDSSGLVADFTNASDLDSAGDIVSGAVGVTEVDEGANFAFTNLTGATFSTGNIVLTAANATVDGVDLDFAVLGPASATDKAIARFDGTTGKLLQDYTSLAPAITNDGVIDVPASITNTAGDLTLAASAGNLIDMNGLVVHRTARENVPDTYGGHRVKVAFPYDGATTESKWAPHTHSAASSDGDDAGCTLHTCVASDDTCCDLTNCTHTPTAVVNAYDSGGWDVITLTDHDCTTADPSGAGIIYIQGVEESYLFFHVLKNNTNTNYAATGTQTSMAQEQVMVDAALNETAFDSDGGSFAILAHPAWTVSGAPASEHELRGIFGPIGLSVYNGGVAAGTDWENGEVVANQILSSHRPDGSQRYFFVATNDSHSTYVAGTHDIAATFVYTEASPTRKDIVDAVRNGNLYAAATTVASDYIQPTAPMTLTGLTLSTEPDEGTSVCEWIGAGAAAEGGNVLETDSSVGGGTPAEYTIVGDEQYVYARCCDGTSCGDLTANCEAVDDPYDCCTGDGTGTCGDGTKWYWTTPVFVETVGSPKPGIVQDVWLGGTINVQGGTTFKTAERGEANAVGMIFDSFDTLSNADTIVEWRNAGTPTITIGGLGVISVSTTNTLAFGAADAFQIETAWRFLMGDKNNQDYWNWTGTALQVFDNGVEAGGIGGNGVTSPNGGEFDSIRAHNDVGLRLRGNNNVTTTPQHQFEGRTGTTTGDTDVYAQFENPSTNIVEMWGDGRLRLKAQISRSADLPHVSLNVPTGDANPAGLTDGDIFTKADSFASPTTIQWCQQINSVVVCSPATGGASPATQIQTSDTALTTRGDVRISATGAGLFYFDTAERQVADLTSVQSFTTGAKTFAAGILTVGADSWTNAQHDHSDADSAGAVPEAGVTFSATGHEHTGTTSGNILPSGAFESKAIDGNDVADGIAGLHLTMNTTPDPDVIDVDLNIATRVKSFNIFDPATGDSDKINWSIADAITIVKVWCSTDVATSTVTLMPDERAEATPNTQGTDILSAALVCDTTSQSSCASGCDVNTISNASIDAYDPVSWDIDATANSPTVVRVSVEFTVDD